MQSPLYSARLMPHRALSLGGIRGVVALMAGLALIPGIIFLAMGAWPVVGFLGLEVVLLYWALNHSLKDGNAFEDVMLFRDSLTIRQVSAAGIETLENFNPFYVRFSIIRDREDRVIALQLITRGRSLEIGRFLPPDDKARFARAFSAALYRAKN